MGCQQSTTKKFEKFTWKIENFSRLNAEKIYSEPFILCGYPWKISLCRKGNKNNLSIYLEAVKTANMSEGWRRDVEYKLVVFNQLGTYTKFTREVFVSKSSREKQVNQGVNLTVSPVSIEPTKKVNAELWYAALGRVVNFLETTKVKDMMNDKTCKELQVLWDKLKKFKIDLTWLEPQVQAALGMKNYAEKALQVEKLKENMAVSELETERLKAKLAAAKVNLGIERDLLKAKGIKERDLDSPFGSVKWKP
ncbi:MATH domain and coiled-coil domain-containing protein [Trifolium repens]|nr:MATH domain and coiled-coil domain-containing protein [Trifolium repens]